MNFDQNENDSGSECGPALPAGVLRSRGGWDGENLEIDHQRERLRSDNNDEEAVTVVDLSQFRNERVGEGYQAKHVIRQNESTQKPGVVVDMSGGKFSHQKGHADQASPPSKKRRNDGVNEENVLKKQQKDVPLYSYLKCKGMRDFLREVEKIINQK